MKTNNVNKLGDRALIRAGARACGSQKAFAARIGLSERAVSEIANGKARLPTTPVPGVGKTPRELGIAAIEAKGVVPEVHRGPGRAHTIAAQRFTVPVPPSTFRRVRDGGLDLSAAVLAFTAESQGAVALMAEEALPVCLTPEAIEAMGAHCGGDVRLRSAFIRAAIGHALDKAKRQRAAA
jgi:hypothetical protein